MRAPPSAIIAAALLLVPLAAAAEKPTPSAPALQSGVTRLRPMSYVYKPEDVTHPAPLIVLLHGAGGDARAFLDLFKPEAEARGAVLLSLQSTGRTWPLKAPSKADKDVDNLHQTLRVLLGKPLVDPRRIVAMGFSDGASYALSLGLSQPNLFRTIVALSPGYAFAPPKPDTRQRIFIVHGRRDAVLPAWNVRRIVKELESAGYRPQVRWFNGGHQIDRRSTQAALDFAIGQ